MVNNKIFVGTNTGVYVSKDKGYTWIDVNDNLEILGIRSLTACNGYLFAITGGSSVYRLDISALSVGDELPPGDFSISPNPAGDFITITMKPSVGSAIQIYNTLGEKVMSESIHPMTASHRMNIESLPKGMYFVRIGGETAKFVKM